MAEIVRTFVLRDGSVIERPVNAVFRTLAEGTSGWQAFASGVEAMPNEHRLVIPLGSYGLEAAREILTLFALTSLGQLMLAIVSLLVLVRYRSLVPLILIVLLTDHLGRRFIVQSYELARVSTTSIGTYINLGLLFVLGLSLVLALAPAQRRAATKQTAPSA